MLVVANAHLMAGLDLVYREGWVRSLIPFEHAWLVYEGAVLEPTLDPDIVVEYGRHVEYSAADVGRSLATTGRWGPVNPAALAALSPWVDVWGMGE
jgi:hypothetical protein